MIPGISGESVETGPMVRDLLYFVHSGNNVGETGSGFFDRQLPQRNGVHFCTAIREDAGGERSRLNLFTRNGSCIRTTRRLNPDPTPPAA